MTKYTVREIVPIFHDGAEHGGVFADNKLVCVTHATKLSDAMTMADHIKVALEAKYEVWPA